MAISLTDIALLRKKIELDRKKLEEQGHALAIVEKMLREEQSGDQKSLGLEERPPDRGGGFPAIVQATLKHFGKDEFSAPDIEEMMIKEKVKLPKTPRARIAMVLKALVDKGEIVRTHSGTGNEPHRYRAKMA